MLQTRCGNPDCPSTGFLGDVLGHWVQVEEIQLVGELRGQGPAQHLYAAVTCSKRCAAVVLAAAADVEEAAEPADPWTVKDPATG